MQARLQQALDRRQSQGALRTLQSIQELKESSRGVDFSSNDYLGLARSTKLSDNVTRTCARQHSQAALGATGSRLLSGDYLYCRKLEEWLARIHNRSAALICNSGYDANLCIASCLPVDVIVMDELCHNSIVMGVQWNSLKNRNVVVEKFRHNDVADLATKLAFHKHRKNDSVVLVLVESVYSMDGDVAPLQDILDTCESYSAHVVVDEAHGLGIYGRTNRRDLHSMADQSHNPTGSTTSVGGTGVLAALNLESHPCLLASVYTFGKAAGCHGAVIACSSTLLKEYLLNYARPLIYSTALPLHSLVTIRCSYEAMVSNDGEKRRRRVFELVRLFRRLVDDMLQHITERNTAASVALLPSNSPIQALLVPGNTTCVEFCNAMKRSHGILLYPIRSPTVARGHERIRIILHAHNTPRQVEHLVECLSIVIQQMRVAYISRL